MVKHGLRGVRLDQEEGVKACEDLWGQLGGDPRIEILKEAVEGTSDETLEFAPRAFFEITRRNLFGKNRSVNLFARISLRSADEATDYGFTEYRVLGTFREPRVFNTAADAFLTAIVGRAVPWIIRGMVPQQVQLMRQESSDSRGHLGECAGGIA